MHLPIIGTRKSLANIDRKVMLDYYKDKYKNLTFVQIGDVESYVEVDKTEGTIQAPIGRAYKTTEADNILIVKKKGITQANVVLGGIIYPDMSDRLDKYFNFEILKGVFNDMSGRLFSKIREEHNLCYRIYFSTQLLSCGSYVWAVQIGLEKDNIDLARKLIIEELTRPITDKELAYAKTKLIGQKALAYDSVSTMANRIAYSDLQWLDYNEQLFNYEKRFKDVKNINKFVKSLNFDINTMVQVIPE